MQLSAGDEEQSQYFVNWTYSLTVSSAATAAALSGATVRLTDAAGATECNLVTNSSGQVACVLTDEDVNNNVTTNHNPHTVTVKSGGTSTSYSLTITGTTTNQKSQRAFPRIWPTRSARVVFPSDLSKLFCA